jgi:hypothetical protein
VKLTEKLQIPCHRDVRREVKKEERLNSQADLVIGKWCGARKIVSALPRFQGKFCI